jgi:hypothetical protein
MQFLSKIDANPIWSYLPPQYIFLIQFLFKIDENPLWSFLPSQYIFLIQFLFKIDENPLWSLPSPPNTYTLFNSYSKLMEILSGASLPHPIHIPY